MCGAHLRHWRLGLLAPPAVCANIHLHCNFLNQHASTPSYMYHSSKRPWEHMIRSVRNYQLLCCRTRRIPNLSRSWTNAWCGGAANKFLKCKWTRRDGPIIAAPGSTSTWSLTVPACTSLGTSWCSRAGYCHDPTTTWSTQVKRRTMGRRRIREAHQARRMEAQAQSRSACQASSTATLAPTPSEWRHQLVSEQNSSRSRLSSSPLSLSGKDADSTYLPARRRGNLYLD
jgi:hypothetical protein